MLKIKAIIFWLILLAIVLLVVFGGKAFIYLGRFFDWLGGVFGGFGKLINFFNF